MFAWRSTKPIFAKVSSWTLYLSSGGELRACDAIRLTMDDISCWNAELPSCSGLGSKIYRFDELVFFQEHLLQLTCWRCGCRRCRRGRWCSSGVRSPHATSKDIHPRSKIRHIHCRIKIWSSTLKSLQTLLNLLNCLKSLWIWHKILKNGLVRLRVRKRSARLKWFTLISGSLWHINMAPGWKSEGPGFETRPSNLWPWFAKATK